MYAPGGRKICASIDTKISAPKTFLKNVIGTEVIYQRLLYETLIYRPNNEQTSNTFVADTDADGLWLKRLHFICIKSPKVICRAVHDATLNNTTRELKNFCCIALLLYYRFKLLKNIHSRKSVWLVPELKHP
jgi:hypothetical protein